MKYLFTLSVLIACTTPMHPALSAPTEQLLDIFNQIHQILTHGLPMSDSEQTIIINKIKELVKQGANINAALPNNKTFLILAVHNKYPLKIIQAIIDAGANVNLTSSGPAQLTPLRFSLLATPTRTTSITQDTLPITKLLLDNGADYNTYNRLTKKTDLEFLQTHENQAVRAFINQYLHSESLLNQLIFKAYDAYQNNDKQLLLEILKAANPTINSKIEKLLTKSFINQVKLAADIPYFL